MATLTPGHFPKQPSSFRSHAGEDRYDAVDGVGYLLLALIYLETSKKPDYLGFGL